MRLQAAAVFMSNTLRQRPTTQTQMAQRDMKYAEHPYIILLNVLHSDCQSLGENSDYIVIFKMYFQEYLMV